MRPMRFLIPVAVVVALLCVISPHGVRACSRVGPFVLEELFEADAVLRVTAVEYKVRPDLNMVTSGIPDSVVEFKVEEVLKGGNVPAAITFNGYLSDEDDFNDVPFPYKFVRPGGRGGSCFANAYKKGAQFLLFVKRKGADFTPYWNALAPTNEQLRDAQDRWVQWARVRINPCAARLGGADEDLTMLSDQELMEMMTNSRFSAMKRVKVVRCYLERHKNEDSDQIRYLKKWVDKFEESLK